MSLIDTLEENFVKTGVPFRNPTLLLVATSFALLSPLAPGVATAASKHSHSSTAFGRGTQTPFLSALRQLDLTADQKSQLHTIVAQARASHATSPAADDFAAMGDPGNPGHAAAVQAAEQRAAHAVQERSELDARVYELLTPAQKAALPGVLAKLRDHSQTTAQAAQ